MISAQTKHGGFSLIELLIAIFILGIGIISIASLLPAGMAQQQKTTDDVIGPIVARNALTILRSRLQQEDFGTTDQFDLRWSSSICETSTEDPITPWPTICGDWMWRHPAIVPEDYGSDNDSQAIAVRGAIDIFATSTMDVINGDGPPLISSWSNVLDSGGAALGIPYSREKYPDDIGNDPGDLADDTYNPPKIRILQGERQYPMWSGVPEDRPTAQYYWDCMFRRYDGRVLVAIFVYRVVDPSNERYQVDTTGLQAPNFPLYANLSTQQTGNWDAGIGNEELRGSELDNPMDQLHQWQFPGQWIVDQNGNIHTVRRGRRRASNSNRVMLTSSPIEIAITPLFNGANVNWWDQDVLPSASGFVSEGVVTDIWFVPTKDSHDRKIIPVFATVEEL